MSDATFNTSPLVEVTIKGNAETIQKFSDFQFDNRIFPTVKFVDDFTFTAIYTQEDYKVIFKWLTDHNFLYDDKSKT